MISARISRKKRQEVYAREGYRCALCDSTKYLQVHHVVKRSKGGTDSVQNMICLCADCHAAAHGTILNDYQASPREVEQAICEYMADHYAEQGILWSPWAEKMIYLTEEG